jgi:hypothetical protein
MCPHDVNWEEFQMQYEEFLDRVGLGEMVREIQDFTDSEADSEEDPFELPELEPYEFDEVSQLMDLEADEEEGGWDDDDFALPSMMELAEREDSYFQQDVRRYIEILRESPHLDSMFDFNSN